MERYRQWDRRGTEGKMSHITAAKWTPFEIPLQHSGPEECF